jgi:ABC-2 type transport system ATP-binding protein
MDAGSVVFDGDPATGLRKLRDGFESDRKDHISELDTFGTVQRIESVELVNATTGQAVTVVKPGDSLRLDVTVHSDTRLEDWVVGMGIDTPLGQVIFGTNTRLLGNRSRVMNGTKVVSFSLPDLRLGNGHYFMHASFGTRRAESALRIEQAVSFDSDDSSNSIGLTSIAATFAVA